jgi:hypothetical protein
MTDSSGGDGSAGEPQGDGGGDPVPRSFDVWLEPYFHDSTLWPVLVVAAAIAVTFAASLLLLALADQRLNAMAALALALGASVHYSVREWRARRRLGLGARSLLGLWSLAAVVAFAANRLGIF